MQISKSFQRREKLAIEFIIFNRRKVKDSSEHYIIFIFELVKDKIDCN